jgi:hypothetical protein
LVEREEHVSQIRLREVSKVLLLRGWQDVSTKDITLSEIAGELVWIKLTKSGPAMVRWIQT